MTVIIGIKLTNKEDNAVELQKVLTKFNCIIKMRLGINSASIFCSSTGIILLQTDSNEDALKIETELLDISGIELQRMVF